MTARPEYIRYLESATQAEFADRLRAEGYLVEVEPSYAGVRFDLVARKGRENLAYEFKSGDSPKNNRHGLMRLQTAAKEAGFEFHIVVVNPPPRVKVEVDNLPAQLKRHLLEHSPPELNFPATRTTLNAVQDLNFSEIHVGEGKIHLAGWGFLTVHLQYETGLYVVPESEDAFPFRFKAVLSADGQLKSVDELTVDTSTFYE